MGPIFRLRSRAQHKIKQSAATTQSWTSWITFLNYLLLFSCTILTFLHQESAVAFQWQVIFYKNCWEAISLWKKNNVFIHSWVYSFMFSKERKSFFRRNISRRCPSKLYLLNESYRERHEIFNTQNFLEVLFESFWISIVMPLGGKMIAFVGGLLSVSFNVSSLVYNLVKISYEQDPRKFSKMFYRH